MGGSSSKESVVGWRYYFGIHMGIGRGPVDAIHEVKVGDRRAWIGEVETNATIDINQPDLFGGEDKEGGVQGPLEVMMGGASQTASAGLVAMRGSTLPGFRRMLTMFFNGLIGANNPYPKPWKFRLNRILQGWDGEVFYPEKARILINDAFIVDPLVKLLTRFKDNDSTDLSSYALGPGTKLNATIIGGEFVVDYRNPVEQFIAYSDSRLRVETGTKQTYEVIFSVPMIDAPTNVQMTLFEIYTGWGTGTERGRAIVSVNGNGTLSVLPYNGGTFGPLFWTSTEDFRDGQQHHIALEFDNTTLSGKVTLWVDGVRKRNAVPFSLGIPESDTYIYLGGWTNTVQNRIHKFHAVRIKKAAVYTTETFTPPTPGELVGDEGGLIPPVYAMNPAHIIFECLTNREWGRGLDRSRIDQASFTACADTLYSEGFGLCMKWTRTDSIEAFIQSVLDHIGGVLFVSRTTALMKLSLIRGGYNIDSLPYFTNESGLLEIRDGDSGVTGRAINKMTVTYHEPESDEDRTVTVNNPAARLNAGGVVNAAKKDYKGLPTADLAARVAQRDLRAASTNLRRVTAVFDRRAEGIEPGSVIAIQDLKRGISKTAFRVGRIQDGTITDGRITMNLVQDVFTLPNSAFVESVPNTWTPPNINPCVPSEQRVIEAPYFLVARNLRPADLDYVTPDGAYLATLCGRGQPLNIGHRINVRTGAPTPDDDPIDDTYVCET